MKRLLSLLQPLIAWIVPVVLWGLYRSQRSVELTISDQGRLYVQSGQPYMVCFWHGRLLGAAALWADRKGGNPKGQQLFVLMSRSRDGQLIADIAKRFGVTAVQGSTARGAVAAGKSALDLLKQGRPVGITPDGPRGPRYHFVSGARRIAEAADVPIFLVSWSAKNAWQAKSWDQQMLPMPFGRFRAEAVGPINLTDAISDDDLEGQLRALTDGLDQACGRGRLAMPSEGEVAKAQKSLAKARNRK